MLTPEYLSFIEFNDVVKIYEQLNIDITSDIIKRVSQMQDITETTKKQLKILKQTNGTEIFNNALERTTMLTSATKEALKNIFQDMAKEDIQGYKELYEYRNKPFKLSELQYKILNQGLKDTNKLLKNFTNTIAFQSQQAYVDTVDSAYMKVSSGAFDYATAINTACQELTDKGITLKDKLGRNVQLEVAVRRNVLTGIQQTANNINRDIEEYLGCDGYEVTAHMGARPTHAEAQGKQYALNKQDANKYNIGLWKDVEDLWSEYNCRHTYFGIILGISEPVYGELELNEMKEATVTFKGKEIPYYEATQKQRQYENAIRKQKRKVQILERANKDTVIEKSQLSQLQKKYKDFCKETGLEKDFARVRVAKVVTNKEKDDKIKLTEIEKNQLTEYTRFDATRINRAIRLDRVDKTIQSKIDVIDNIFNKNRPLEKDIIVHRGTIIQSISGFEKIKKVEHKTIMDLKEQFIVDRAFISTSKDKAEMQGRNIIMKIHVPKGYKGILDIEQYAVEKYKYQKEMLLKRNTKFFINNIEFKDGKYYLDMEVIE